MQELSAEKCVASKDRKSNAAPPLANELLGCFFRGVVWFILPETTYEELSSRVGSDSTVPLH